MRGQERAFRQVNFPHDGIPEIRTEPLTNPEIGAGRTGSFTELHILADQT